MKRLEKYKQGTFRSLMQPLPRISA